jgi:hypothetical protein
LDLKARLLAYYLPQFHPIQENDLHWGRGFTEWTNVTKSKPLFKGHYQPHLPTELGYYDLRLPEVRQAQADLAKEYGIEGFCYWHYWFAGKRLLERPFNEVVNSGKPDFPFCLCWANHTWSKAIVGDNRTIIMEQTYPGIQDYIDHFYSLLPAFSDKRYIKVNGKLLFSIFAPSQIPNSKEFTDTWRELAIKEGIADFHFIGICATENELQKYGIDAVSNLTPHPYMHKIQYKIFDKISFKLFRKKFAEAKHDFFKIPIVYSYAKFVDVMLKLTYTDHEYPVALPNWDHSPRSGSRALVLHNSSPELFGKHLQHCIESIADRPFENRIVFIKSWNEWAEGNYLEPERRYGRAYLEEIKKINTR